MMWTATLLSLLGLAALIPLAMIVHAAYQYKHEIGEHHAD